MIAFDTNLLVRIAVNDDQTQADIAEQLINNNDVFISRTVLLETEWVLRSVYKISRSDIASFFENVLITENIVIENPTEVGQALGWYKLGADFADAMHLCICGDSLMHTFDAEFCKAASRAGITPAFKVLK
ncbi:type II toxin-antitoxin system VapC family toxin [Thiothrix unzii]|uniref:Type II toxin-antitoxin system VapC family toxin n=1 Tax=Thiothrix unzii TaxID=111769 RepID=A0A975F6C1_9GAMM|nr:type II toxin-antitoxin system VapC family toxin [Thiothrix unzii]QTR52255.1 type II toxin-antitoxin system VapC family toxin [Thiothrix unzii]